MSDVGSWMVLQQCTGAALMSYKHIISVIFVSRKRHRETIEMTFARASVRLSDPNLLSATPLRCLIRFSWNVAFFFALLWKCACGYESLFGSFLTVTALLDLGFQYKKLGSATPLTRLIWFSWHFAGFLALIWKCACGSEFWLGCFNRVTAFLTFDFHIKSLGPQLLLHAWPDFHETSHIFLLRMKLCMLLDYLFFLTELQPFLVNMHVVLDFEWIVSGRVTSFWTSDLHITSLCPQFSLDASSDFLETWQAFSYEDMYVSLDFWFDYLVVLKLFSTLNFRI